MLHSSDGKTAQWCSGIDLTKAQSGNRSDALLEVELRFPSGFLVSVFSVAPIHALCGLHVMTGLLMLDDRKCMP